MTNKQFEDLSPCEHSNRGTVNLIHDSNGVMHRIAATKNAVVIQVFDELRDEYGNLKTVTHIECKDSELQEELIQIAKRVIASREQPNQIIDELVALLSEADDTVSSCCDCIRLASDKTLQPRINNALAKAAKYRSEA